MHDAFAIIITIITTTVVIWCSNWNYRESYLEQWWSPRKNAPNIVQMLWSRRNLLTSHAVQMIITCACILWRGMEAYNFFYICGIVFLHEIGHSKLPCWPLGIRKMSKLGATFIKGLLLQLPIRPSTHIPRVSVLNFIFLSPLGYIKIAIPINTNCRN